jgi:hypothetical protein
VNLTDGTIVGHPTPAVPDDAVRIDPLPAGLPAPLKPRPIIVRVPAPTTTSTTAGTTTAGQQTPTSAQKPAHRPAQKPRHGAGR